MARTQELSERGHDWSFREIWELAGPFVAWITSGVVKDSGWVVAILMGYTLPLAWCAIKFRFRREFRVLPGGTSIPNPESPGPVPHTLLLAELHGAIERDLPGGRASELRVTLFVPDQASFRLFQLARHRWTGHTEVSATSIRFGVCAVGHAYNRQRTWHVADVKLYGGFTECLVWCGMTREEAGEQRLERGCFAAIPLLYTDKDGAPKTFAVIAVDAKQSTALPVNLEELVLQRQERFGRLMLPNDIECLEREPLALVQSTNMADQLLTSGTTPSQPMHGLPEPAGSES